MHWLTSDPALFPPVERASTRPNGLLAAGGDLRPERLVAAYRRGIFPWYNPDEPPLWWSPDPRMVLFPAEFKLMRSLAKRIRRKDFEIRVDSAFGAVMAACAAPRDGQAGTWITPEVYAGYCGLHAAGLAHSVETWIDGELVGGLYGVALGRAFYGESMFMRRTDASKLALAHLVRQLTRWEFGVIDCQMNTNHLASLGAREISRADFVGRLADLVDLPGVPGPWCFDDDLF